MESVERMQKLREEVRHCQRCPLAITRKNAVPGEGPVPVKVMLIGEGPGYHENEQGKPFVGQAGKFLDELLAAGGLTREEVFITNVVKCRPPDNRDPQPDELAACRFFLDEQIKLLLPKVIITLGRFSMARFFENARISRMHGQTFHVDDQTVVTMYHPAAALHQPALRGDLLSDFALLPGILGNHSPHEADEPRFALVEQNESPDDQNPAEQLSLF